MSNGHANPVGNKTQKKITPAGNEGFGVRRGVVSWDTSQDFGSSPPVRAFVNPRLCNRWGKESDTKETKYIIKKALRTIDK